MCNGHSDDYEEAKLKRCAGCQRVRSIWRRARLGTFLNMRTGLIEFLKVPPKTIHDWRVRGVLVDEIKATFYDVPEKSRGRYFCWFLQNEHIVALAGQPLPDETFYDHAAAMLLHACRFTEGSERDSAEEVKAAMACKSDKEQECHLM